jgi:hypothetical protein
VALGGGAERFLEVLEDSIQRRREGEVPRVDARPEWSLTFDRLDPKLERVHESLLALGDGCIGTRGAPLLMHPAAMPGVLMSGDYRCEGPLTELEACPDWTRLEGRLPAAPALRRQLD